MHDYSTQRQDIQKIQTWLEDIDTQQPEDNDKVRLWNDIKVRRIITALDDISEFKEYLTLHANRRLGRDLKSGEVQTNTASSERKAHVSTAEVLISV